MDLTPNQQYYLKHKERMKEYYLKNKEEIRQKQKLYYETKLSIVEENKFKIVFHGPSRVTFN